MRPVHVRLSLILLAAWTGACTNTDQKPQLAAAAPRPTVHAWFVESGLPRSFGFYAFLNPDCSVLATPRITVERTPLHGRVEIVPTSDFPLYPAENPRSACNRRRVPGMRVTYVSAPDYAGYDAFLFRVVDPATGSVTEHPLYVLVRPPVPPGGEPSPAAPPQSRT